MSSEILNEIDALPLPDGWKSKATTIDLEGIQKLPGQKEVLCGYFPSRATSAIVAMGGVGKTLWATTKAIQHVNEDFHVMFISAEDTEDDYQAKVHNALFSDWQNACTEGRSAETVAGKIHVLNIRGEGLKLISEAGGSFVPSLFSEKLGRFIAESYPKVRVVFFETLSRLAGGEDNDRMEAIVSACDKIAIAINGASVLIHHTGKTQGRENVIDLYAGRGGSALGDNTRSFVVLTRISSGETGHKGTDAVVIDPDDLAAGRAFEVTHVRNSYGPKQPSEYFITRPGSHNGPALESISIATPEDLTRAKLERIERRELGAMNKVHDVIKAKGGKVEKKYFDSKTKDLIGLSQKDGRALIEDMIQAGSIFETEVPKGKTRMKMLSIVRPDNNAASTD